MARGDDTSPRSALEEEARDGLLRVGLGGAGRKFEHLGRVEGIRNSQRLPD
jgi:hypothetical protein